MGKYCLSASAAWKTIEELMEDERLDFVTEPALVDTVLPKLLKYSTPTNKLVGDAYLAAFSIAGQMRLATIDRGFKQFRELDLALLIG
jgi:predicted nucleic acid-binding protein